jgi:ParB-like chromosome segregation protein Spo0J
MFSVKLKNPEIVVSITNVNIHELKPHENVISVRQNTLKDYLKSYKDYVVIPSILCCHETGIIIDGHHRYFAMLELGSETIPVTKIRYLDDSIRTHHDLELSLKKKDIIEAALTQSMLEPKSTIHEFLDEEGNWKPIILLSTLSEFKLP